MHISVLSSVVGRKGANLWVGAFGEWMDACGSSIGESRGEGAVVIDKKWGLSHLPLALAIGVHS